MLASLAGGGGLAVEEPQEVQDEEYGRVYERAAAVDVAKASGVVCTRVPDEARPGRRRTLVWTVTATMNAVTETGRSPALPPDRSRHAGINQ